MKKWVSIEDKIIPGLFIVLLIFIWQFVVGQGWIEKYILPAPSDIGYTLIQIIPEIKTHLFYTLEEALIGLFLATFFAIFLAVLMENIKLLKKVVYPLVIVSQTVPIIVLAPLFVLWFGFGLLPKIIIVVLVCFFPIVISLLDGFESIDPDILNLLKSMEASSFQIFKLVKFPAAMAHFFSGLRIAATYSIMGAIIGEWVGGSNGLGVYMIRAKHSYALDKVFAVVIIIVILSMMIFKMIALLQYLLMPWDR